MVVPLTGNLGLLPPFIFKVHSKFLQRVQPINSLNIIFRNVMTDENNPPNTSRSGDHLQVTSTHQRDPDIHEVKVSKMVNISPTVKKLILQTDIRPVPFSFKAGQWVDVFIPGLPVVGGFSMTSSPTCLTASGQLHLAVKHSDHKPAKWVHEECIVGSTLTIRVGGDFFIDSQSIVSNQTTRLLFIAGGVGINPLCSMIAEMRDLMQNQSPDSRPLNLKSVLLFSAKTTDELLFKEELDSLARNDSSNFRPFYFITKEPHYVSQRPSNSKKGRIDAESLLQIIPDHLALQPNSKEIEALEVYLCGPPSFITSIDSALKNMGIKKIFFENWWISE